MTENTENLFLDTCAPSASILAELRMISGLEAALARLWRDSANLFGEVVETRARYHRRIEQRLELRMQAPNFLGSWRSIPGIA
jgi:hypothetical protein